MRRICGRGLSSGTVAERIAPESVTRLHSGFVHRNISRWRSGCGIRSSLVRLHKGPIGGAILKNSAQAESNQKWERVNRIPSFLSPRRPRAPPGARIVVIARSEATKQSILALLPNGLLRGVYH